MGLIRRLGALKSSTASATCPTRVGAAKHPAKTGSQRPWWANLVYDAVTRQEVGEGLVTGASAGATCHQVWWGARDAYPCFAELAAEVAARFATCNPPSGTCNVCDCRLNHYNDVLPSECL